MSRCQQYIASVHISCQISYHHDYRHPRHNVVERLDTYWFMICCQKCLIWHHHICWWYVRIYGTYWTRICWLYLVKGPWYGVTTICWWYAHIYMIHIRHVSVDDCLSKAPNMGVTAICSSLIFCNIICTKIITIQWLFLSSLQAYCKFIIILVTCLRQNLTFLTSACIWYFHPFPSSCWPPLRNAATPHQELTNSYVCMWDRGCDQNAFLSIISSGFWSCSTNRCSPPMPL